MKYLQMSKEEILRQYQTNLKDISLTTEDQISEKVCMLDIFDLKHW